MLIQTIINDVIQNFVNSSRSTKQKLLLMLDFFSITACILLSFSLRFGHLYFPADDIFMMLFIFMSTLLALTIFFSFGLYREVIRYVGFNALWRIFKAISLYSILLGLIAFMTNLNGIPRSVILINWLLAIVTISSIRLSIRWLITASTLKDSSLNTTNVLIYGAGSAGRQLYRALNESSEYNSVAFIDDSSEIHHTSINGLAVYSQDDIKDLVKKNNIKEILLAMPLLTRARRFEIITYLKSYPVLVRSLPSLTKLAQGKVTVNDLLEVDLIELLGRTPVIPNKQLLKTNIFNKVVLVTGAGGSIGAELCRQILSLEPHKLILYDISESSLYLIEQELININSSNIEILPVIGSVLDLKRLKYMFNFYSVQTIYHAAAYKHVPLVEFNQSQGVLNNTIGTLIAAKAAIYSNVDTFVLISTDKAVRPTNIMGASKRAAELTLQALNKEPHNTCFTMVRFGNVLNSSGSVIPLFKKQIKAGGPVTVTHANIVRYFMTIPEAVELVIQAGAMAEGGEVFLLDMGKPIRIHDLAIKMIQLSGLIVRDENNPKGDIEIKYTGLRPGEKLYEELLIGDNYSLTQNKLIMRSEEKMINWDKLEPVLAKIEKASKNVEIEKIYKLLIQLVPEFNPKPNGFDGKEDIK
jgi:FlaA1/EpsC-like NDP-sugar epimerase